MLRDQLKLIQMKRGLTDIRSTQLPPSQAELLQIILTNQSVLYTSLIERLKSTKCHIDWLQLAIAYACAVYADEEIEEDSQSAAEFFQSLCDNFGRQQDPLETSLLKLGVTGHDLEQTLWSLKMCNVGGADCVPRDLDELVSRASTNLTRIHSKLEQYTSLRYA